VYVRSGSIKTTDDSGLNGAYQIVSEQEDPDMSKFSLDILKNRVFPFADMEDTDVILGAAFGEDVALTQIGGDILISHLDPIVNIQCEEDELARLWALYPRND
jgi:hypothetical protein